MTKVSVLTLTMLLKDMMALEFHKERGWRSVKMKRCDQELVCSSVFIIVAL